MTDSVLDRYLDRIDPVAHRSALALDTAIMGAHPKFDVAIKYRILMYSINADWHNWVVAVDAGGKRISLRFHWGVLLDDPRGVLRKGSSVLSNWDFGFDDPIDAKAVRAYVKEAVATKDDYLDNRTEVQAAARTVKARRP